MDTTNIKYRIRQCSECSGNLKYFCQTCSFYLCLQCGENHVMSGSKNDIHNIILYREKFNKLRKHEICVRHPGSVYDNYCEVCKIPICTDCTDHKTHTQTDVGTAYEKKRQNREIIKKKILNESLPLCFALQTSIDMDLKTLFSDIAKLNSEMIKNSEQLTGCLDPVLHNFHLEHRCLKQKKELNKYIASTYLYEHVYEHSSDAPIKFLSSVKKHLSSVKKHGSKDFKNHAQITLSKPLKKTEAVIEKLLTIKFTNKGMRQTGNEVFSHWDDKFIKMLRDPQSILSFMKGFPMLLSQFPTEVIEPELADCLPGLCDTLSNLIAEGNVPDPEPVIRLLSLK